MESRESRLGEIRRTIKGRVIAKLIFSQILTIPVMEAPPWLELHAAKNSSLDNDLDI